MSKATRIQMKLVTVNKATINQLNWLISKILGESYLSEAGYDGIGHRHEATAYATDWAQGGPLFSEAGIAAFRMIGLEDKVLWGARSETENGTALAAYGQGDTELIAKARCYISLRLGENAEVPEELA